MSSNGAITETETRVVGGKEKRITLDQNLTWGQSSLIIIMKAIIIFNALTKTI